MSGNDGIVWYLRTHEEYVGSVVVLRLEGRVSSATSDDLAQALDRARSDGRRALVVDMTAVDYINGRGLSILAAAAARFRAAGRELIACGLSPAVRTAFDLSDVAGRVTVEPSRDAALRRATDLSGS